MSTGQKADQAPEGRKPVERTTAEAATPTRKPAWETPKMQDVSEQVMAQPYIRFT